MPTRNRTWFSLLTLCLIQAIAVATAFAIILIGGTLTFAGGQSPKVPRKNLRSQGAASLQQSFTGVVTDSDCGARHDKDAGMSSAECTRACVRNGPKYTLVDGEKSYFLSGDQREIGKVAGQRVKVIGTLEGDNIRVHSVGAQ